VAFAPDGKWVITAWPDDSLRLWPVPPNGRDFESLYRGKLPGGWWSGSLYFDSAGTQIVKTGYGLDLSIGSVDGSALRKLEGFSDDHLVRAAAFSPTGRLVAAGTSFGSEVEKVLRIWDLESGEVRVLDLEQTKVRQEEGPESGTTAGGLSQLAFADESTLYTATWGGQGILRWDLETGMFEQFRSPEGVWGGAFWMSGDRRQMITHVWRPGELVFGPPLEYEPLLIHDLDTGQAREVETHWEPDKGWLTAIDSTLSIMVVVHPDGTLGVSRLNDPEPHLLVGHEGLVKGVAISRDLQWIASTGQDNTLRLWPMPDLDKPPLHTLPRQELVAKLESLTNVRAVRDPASSTGWSIEVGPFPGWEKVPEW
jgi:WD40 repeat protein